MCCMISALLVAEEKRKQKEQLKILKQQVELQLFGFFWGFFFFLFLPHTDAHILHNNTSQKKTPHFHVSCASNIQDNCGSCY